MYLPMKGVAVNIPRLYATSLRYAAKEWRERPREMAKKLAFSAIAGQGVFWVLGYDQLGLFMKPWLKMGLGQYIAEKAYTRLPKTATAAWSIKVLEILADAGKCPVEGMVYMRHGYAPDGVAMLVTQPLWSTIEVGEKIAGAALHPERVTEPENVKLSLGCIYGSFFRYGQSAVLLYFGPQLYGAFECAVEKALPRQ